MIHLGAMVGRAVSAHDSFIAGIGKYMPPIEKLFSKLRNERDARDFVTAGTAAGVAAAFGAPVTGVLFALEEIASAWSPSLTWKVFLTSMVADLVTSIFLSMHAQLEEHAVYEGGIKRSSIEFYQAEQTANNVGVISEQRTGGSTRSLRAALLHTTLHDAPRPIVCVADPLFGFRGRSLVRRA